MSPFRRERSESCPVLRILPSCSHILSIRCSSVQSFSFFNFFHFFFQFPLFSDEEEEQSPQAMAVYAQPQYRRDRRTVYAGNAGNTQPVMRQTRAKFVAGTYKTELCRAFVASQVRRVWGCTCCIFSPCLLLCIHVALGKLCVLQIQHVCSAHISSAGALHCCVACRCRARSAFLVCWLENRLISCVD